MLGRFIDRWRTQRCLVCRTILNDSNPGVQQNGRGRRQWCSVTHLDEWQRDIREW